MTHVTEHRGRPPPPRTSFFDGLNIGNILQLVTIVAAVIGGVFSTYLAMAGRIEALSNRLDRQGMQIDELSKQFNARGEEQKAFVRELYQQLQKVQETLVDVRISVAGSGNTPAARR